MPNPKDFLAKQIRVTQVLASGSVEDAPQLMIYRSIDAPDYDGSIPTHISDAIANVDPTLPSIGSDVWLYVDGASGPGPEAQLANQRADGSVVLFAGDVVISGTLYSERQVMEVTTHVGDSYEGDMFISGNLFARDQETSHIAAGSNQWVDFQKSDGTSLFVIDSTNERVGVHTSKPQYYLHVIADGDEGNKGRIGITQYRDSGSPTDGADLMIQRYRGNSGATAAVVDGDRLGSIYFQGAISSDTIGDDQIAAGITSVVQGTPTTGGGGVPAGIGLRTSYAPGGANLEWRLFAGASGMIGVGGGANQIKNAEAQLHLRWSAADGTQADAVFDPTITNLVGDGPLKIRGLQEFTGDNSNKKNLVIDENGVVKWGAATIGDPCDVDACDPNESDETYEDGLWPFTEDTTVGCAVDRLNEVLAQLAPPPAPLANCLGGQLWDNNQTPLSTGQSFKVTEVTNSAWQTGAKDIEGTQSFAGPTAHMGVEPAVASVDALYAPTTYAYAAAEDTKFALEPTVAETDVRMGCFWGDQSIAGGAAGNWILKVNINFDDGPNGTFPNYPLGAFGKADQGSIRVFLNSMGAPFLEVPDLSIDVLIDATAGASNITLTEHHPAHFDSGEELCTYFHRTGDVEINTLDMMNGWNWLKIIHDPTGAWDNAEEANWIHSNYITWVMDAHTTSPFVSGEDHDPGAGGTYVSMQVDSGTGNVRMLSGVPYHVGGTVEYQCTINRAYSNFYSPLSDSLQLRTAPGVTKRFVDQDFDLETYNPGSPGNAVAFTPASPAGTITRTFLAPNNVSRWMLGGTAGTSVNIMHPFDDDLTPNVGPNRPNGTNTWTNCRDDGAHMIASFLLYDPQTNDTDGATNTWIERFRSEEFRLQPGSYNLQTDISGGSNAWDTAVHIGAAAGNSGYDDGLMCYADGLLAAWNTTNTPIVTGNFIPVVYGPGNNGQPDTGSNGLPNYSAEAALVYAANSSLERTFYRKFTNSTGSTQSRWMLKVKGAGVDLVSATNGTSFSLSATDQVHIFFKMSGVGNSEWLDMAKAFSNGQSNSAGEGCFDGSFGDGGNAGDDPTASGRIYGVNFGTDFIPDGEAIVIKIVAQCDFSEKINELELQWGNTWV